MSAAALSLEREIYEGGTDWLLDNERPLQDSLADTNTDLLYGALGSTLGALLLVGWTRRGWTMTRRIPAEDIRAWIASTQRVRQLLPQRS